MPHRIAPVHTPKLSKDDVAVAALRILNEWGLPDLTMRRLASELGVQPSALYWYYPNKQTLLAEIADRILKDARPVSADESWDQRLRLEAFALRDALLAYRDSAEIVSATLALGLGKDSAQARLSDSFASSGFDAESVRRAVATMLHFVLGHVSLEQQRLQYDMLGALTGDSLAHGSKEQEGDFEFGVDTVIAGLERAIVGDADCR